jgi:hypothetical protein
LFYTGGGNLSHKKKQVLSPTKKETSYSDQIQNFAGRSKKIRRLSVQPGLRGSNDLRVGRKMSTFQLFFFHSDRAKDLSAPLYKYSKKMFFGRTNPIRITSVRIIRVLLYLKSVTHFEQTLKILPPLSSCRFPA